MNWFNDTMRNVDYAQDGRIGLSTLPYGHWCRVAISEIMLYGEGILHYCDDGRCSLPYSYLLHSDQHSEA